LVFIDKNFPKDAIGKVMTDVEDVLPSNVDAKYYYLIPDVNTNDQILRLPLSASFMLQTFARCQKRTEHSTLDNKDPVKLVEIQTMFMLLNREVKFDQKFIDDEELDGFLKLPMSNESITIPNELLEALTKIMINFRGVGKTNVDLIDQFLNNLRKYDSLLSKHVSTD
jgi:hypothetical protein